MDIRITHNGPILDIQLTRPEAKNSLNQSMYHTLADTITQANRSAETRAIVLRGLPEIFCGGNDMQDFVAISQGMADFHGERFMKSLVECETPIVASVSGPAIGIGTTMLQFVDVVYCSPSAVFKTPFVQLGLCPEMASSTEFSKLVGPRKAKEMLLLGTAMTAEEALTVGFVNQVSNTPDDTAQQCAKQIAQLPPKAMRISKRMLGQQDKARLLRTIEDENVELIKRIRSEEAKEAVSAFLEKRPAQFS
ncbi:enoyl-CoA hydratase-related protein [Photobacterium lutimaris]|uniref:Enoyl-CoA hydratase n=1 Tax=Photobacterium lutimaris TaxID=388278 RepID=A0A2T3J1W0_9GAMM|nr:enoyl-CoA hydratase-related protein [Photobacterium lutimaris]PSU35071.1 enoyl-CoA hydratase [Photobacterium lutimaris]TDR77432.1 enoyl-CoA hydratase/carnithine racemase [Photobacterium lutimaris]